MDIRKQSIDGAIWTFIDIVVNRGAYFFATIILAGILGPKEFGLLGMIMLFVGIGNTFIDSGMSTSLLRTNTLFEKDFSTVFVTNVIMSLFVYLIIFLLAPFIAAFYKQDVLVKLIRVYSIGFVINSLRSIHSVKLMKELKFKQLAMLSVPGNFISALLAIWMGYSGYGIWSLVFLFLVNQIISTLIFFLFIHWRPTINFDFATFKYHFNFGYKLVLSTQLNIIFENVNNVLIGKFYDVKILGFYERAYTLNYYPVSVLSSTVLKVSLPSLTLIKDDKLRLQRSYKNIMQMTFFLSASFLAFAALFSTQIIELVLGERWIDSAPFFKILCLSFVFYPIHSLNINILSLYGRSDLFLKLEIVKKLAYLIVIAIVYKFGITGLVWGNVINSILGLIINAHYSGIFLNYPTIDQLKDLLPTIGIVALTSFFLYFFQSIFNTNHLTLQILISFLIGLIVLIFLGKITRNETYLFIKQLLLEQIKR